MNHNPINYSTCHEAAEELGEARMEHGPMHSAHEGYAVILEELGELWDEIKAKVQDNAKMRKEAIQVAAMALRFVEDVCDAPKPGGEALPLGHKHLGGADNPCCVSVWLGPIRACGQPAAAHEAGGEK